MKKFLLFVAALCFSATMFAQSIFSDSQGLYYQTILDDEGNETGNCEIIACQDENEVYEGEITIPETVNGYNVTRIADYAFQDSEIEGDLVIPGTLLYFGHCCFRNCDGLESVTFEYGETELTDENTTEWEMVFTDCDNITVVYLDRDVVLSTQSKVVAPFSYVAGIQTVYIGEHVTYIPNYMFRANNANYGGGTLSTVYSDAATPPGLGTAVFGNNINEVWGGEFYFYTKADYLNNYKADKDWVAIFTKAYMHAYDGDDPEEPSNENAFQDENGLWYEIIFDEDGNATDNCQLIAPPVQAEDQVYSGSVTIPAEVNGYNVTRIDAYAFSDSEISGTLTIPGTITNMGVYAFNNCYGLTHVIYEYSADELIEDAASNPGDYSFANCSGVEWVELYRDIKVGRNNGLCAPFTYNTAVNTVIVGEAVTYIPGYMFYNNKTNTLMYVTCYAVEPPTLGTAPFNGLNADCVLYVYNDYISAYEDSDWGAAGFAQILPIEGVEEGITDIKAETSAKVSGIYNVAGQRVNENAKGLLIKDGKKVLVK